MGLTFHNVNKILDLRAHTFTPYTHIYTYTHTHTHTHAPPPNTHTHTHPTPTPTPTHTPTYDFPVIGIRAQNVHTQHTACGIPSDGQFDGE